VYLRARLEALEKRNCSCLVGSRIHDSSARSQPNNLYGIVMIVMENHSHSCPGISNEIPTATGLFMYDSGRSNEFSFIQP
jgi:hypothetical protein